MFDPSLIPYVTEEMLLEKFNGDVYKAAAYAKVLLEIQKERLEHSKMFLPGTPYMNAVLREIDEEFEWDMMTPWWKKLLVKIGLMKRGDLNQPSSEQVYQTLIKEKNYDWINT